MDPLTLLTGLIPVAGHVIDALTNRFIAPEKLVPATVDDYIKMKNADIDAFKAMNNIGGSTYMWVEAIIKLQRPIVVIGVLSGCLAMHLLNLGNTDVLDNALGAVGSYLFMDRTMLALRKK